MLRTGEESERLVDRRQHLWRTFGRSPTTRPRQASPPTRRPPARHQDRGPRRHALCQTRITPPVEEFGVWLKERHARLSAKSCLSEKPAYIARHQDGLRVFLDDGRVEMDSNSAENPIRPVALNRKNALVAGHDGGTAAWDRIVSLIETARRRSPAPASTCQPMTVASRRLCRSIPHRPWSRYGTYWTRCQRAATSNCVTAYRLLSPS